MENIYQFFTSPWPWYISGPLIGLMVPLLLLAGNKPFGLSSSLKHICAMCVPSSVKYFKYEWRDQLWNVVLVIGIVIGGYLGSLISENDVVISDVTVSALYKEGVRSFHNGMPVDIFNWSNLFSLQGFLLIVVGGFFVGFGTRYAEGCTSGHAIMGLSILSWQSLIAVVSFFIGGLVMTHLLLPFILQL